MIPLAHIQQWTAHAPWPDLRQVEQDLIISRGLCDLFSSKQLQDRIAFRGGTAIHKLLFDRPLRYSEDIDLIQTKAEPIKSTVAEIRNVLSWLGKCSYNAAAHSVHLEFKFSPESDTGSRLKLKIEINTREHEPRYDLKMYPFEVSSDWYQGHALIHSFEPEELFGTKLRALLQRHKNRDLFDLNLGLLQLGLDGDRIIECFQHYVGLQGQTISRANAEERMLKKLNRSLTEDISPLLPRGIHFSDDDAISAFGRVWVELIGRLPGDPWKSSQMIIDTIRQLRIPDFLKEADE